MKQGIKTVLNKIAFKFNQSLLVEFFGEQFNHIKMNNQIDSLTFNNFTGLPLVISKKLFHAFDKSKHNALNKRDFITGMTQLYSASYMTRLILIFTVLDYNNDKIIAIDDLKHLLLIFHLLTNKSEVSVLLQQVDLMFQNKTEMNFQEFLDIATTRTSDIALLLLFFIYHNSPIMISCIEYYKNIKYPNGNGDEVNEKEPKIQRGNKKLNTEKINFSEYQKEFGLCLDDNKSNEKNDDGEILKLIKATDNEQKESITFIEASPFLYEYLRLNYETVVNDSDESESDQSEDELSNPDTYSDLDELKSFEEDLSTVTSQLSQKDFCNYSNSKMKHSQLSPDFKSRKYLGFEFNQTTIGTRTPLKSPSYKSQGEHGDGSILRLNLNSIIYDNEHKNRKSLIQLCEISLLETHHFQSQCIYTDDNTGLKFNTKVTIMGNMIFVNWKKEKSSLFKKMLSLRKLFAQNPKEIKAINDKFPVVIYSTISGKIDKYTFSFNEKEIAMRFIKVINRETKYQRFDNEYEIGQILGFGSCGVVKLVTKKNTNEHYAVKIISMNYDSRSDIKYAYNELDISKLLTKVSHPNIVKFYDYFETVNDIYIIMEDLDGKSLESFINTYPDQLMKYKKQLTNQIIDSLQTLYFYGIVHRDIKPENIMVINYEKSYQIKLIDFGFSKVISKTEKIKESLGTLSYASPEVILNQHYSFKIDIWSFGVILYFFIYGRLPFTQQGNGPDTVMSNIVHGCLYFPAVDITNELDTLLYMIMVKCLERDTSKRASICHIYKIWNENVIL